MAETTGSVYESPLGRTKSKYSLQKTIKYRDIHLTTFIIFTRKQNMATEKHEHLVGFIWNIANKLRGPYRPPQYRRVMLPMIVLRRLDFVLAPTKDAVIEKYKQLQARNMPDEAMEKILGDVAAKDRQQPLYNVSNYTFEKLIADPPNIARNLVDYIQGFSPKAREILAKFDFEKEIEKLDNSNRLFKVLKEFCKPEINLHPDVVTNLQMGYVFEELVRKFNEQANEEAGDHFTPREVIRLMAHLMYTRDEDVYRPGIARTIYDPACGTGGMLSISEEYIRGQNEDVQLFLYGQEYNNESYAICGSDLLIKDEPIDNLVFGDTLTHDGFSENKFHYMMANPPFGVEWKTQKITVEKESAQLGFDGRFGAGTPRINDGALLFLQHMCAKMHDAPEKGGDGSKIAIVFNGSPLFTGAAGSGESNIRRWIIENDWLDAIVALPDQMFYNTGIYTYIWIVTNKKPSSRKGKVQLIDGTRHYQKMPKSLGDKRHELSDAHIDELTRLYANYEHDETASVKVEKKGEDTKTEERVCSKIFSNQEFGFLKVAVERPLKLNFQARGERIEKLKSETAFENLAKSKKRKDADVIAKEEAEGRAQQESILAVLAGMSEELYKNRKTFLTVLKAAFAGADVKLETPILKAILSALSERDETADVCTNTKGDPEADKSLSDTELIPLPKTIPLPLPIGYDKKADNSELVAGTKDHCEAYLAKEVLPHVPDAWIDYSKTKVGYEISLVAPFYLYEPPRMPEEIKAEIQGLESQVRDLLGGLTK